MKNCRICEVRLGGYYTAGRELKSCPNCSAKAGVHVYLPLEAFGQHGTRADADGEQYDQSWCLSCREESMNGEWKVPPDVRPTLCGRSGCAPHLRNGAKVRATRAKYVEALPFWERAR